MTTDRQCRHCRHYKPRKLRSGVSRKKGNCPTGGVKYAIANACEKFEDCIDINQKGER